MTEQYPAGDLGKGQAGAGTATPAEAAPAETVPVAEAESPGGTAPSGEPATPAGSGGRTRTYLIGGAVLLLLAILISLVAVALVGRDGPRETVDSYLDAAKDRDTGAMTDHLCALQLAMAAPVGGMIINQQGSGDLLQAKIVSVREAERTAEVTVESNFSHEGIDGPVRTETVTLTLVREDGRWLICGARRTAGED